MMRISMFILFVAMSCSAHIFQYYTKTVSSLSSDTVIDQYIVDKDYGWRFLQRGDEKYKYETSSAGTRLTITNANKHSKRIEDPMAEEAMYKSGTIQQYDTIDGVYYKYTRNAYFNRSSTNGACFTYTFDYYYVNGIQVKCLWGDIDNSHKYVNDIDSVLTTSSDSGGVGEITGMMYHLINKTFNTFPTDSVYYRNMTHIGTFELDGRFRFTGEMYRAKFINYINKGKATLHAEQAYTSIDSCDSVRYIDTMKTMERIDGQLYREYGDSLFKHKLVKNASGVWVETFWSRTIYVYPSFSVTKVSEPNVLQPAKLMNKKNQYMLNGRRSKQVGRINMITKKF